MAHDDDLHEDEFNDQDSHEESGEQETGTKEAAASDDDIEYGSQAAREALREAKASDDEAFLARGGRIQEVASDVMGDPPRKPQTNYGSRPI